jgi:hypothetical protein
MGMAQSTYLNVMDIVITILELCLTKRGILTIRQFAQRLYTEMVCHIRDQIPSAIPHNGSPPSLLLIPEGHNVYSHMTSVIATPQALTPQIDSLQADLSTLKSRVDATEQTTLLEKTRAEAFEAGSDSVKQKHRSRHGKARASSSDSSDSDSDFSDDCYYPAQTTEAEEEAERSSMRITLKPYRPLEKFTISKARAVLIPFSILTAAVDMSSLVIALYSPAPSAFCRLVFHESPI